METTKPLVKVCGITSLEDARAALEAGVDLIGLNFHPPSPRCVDPPRAAEIRRTVGRAAVVVGVFVHHGIEEIETIDRHVGLDLVQLHGDGSLATAEHFGRRAVPVFRLAPGGDLPPRSLRAFPRAWGFLADVHDEEVVGGTGRAWSYERVAGVPDGRPFLVAGGVTPETAPDALTRSGASGVDVASGVESAPGRKDPARMKALVEAVRAYSGT